MLCRGCPRRTAHRTWACNRPSSFGRHRRPPIRASAPQGSQSCIAKTIKEGFRFEGAYFVDIEMQAQCQAIADAFNAYNPPKPVRFVPAYIVKREATPHRPEQFMAVEPYMSGTYIKYNNNWGFVSYNDRNTPQAFSHYSHHHTGGRLIIIDIQVRPPPSPSGIATGEAGPGGVPARPPGRAGLRRPNPGSHPRLVPRSGTRSACPGTPLTPRECGPGGGRAVSGQQAATHPPPAPRPPNSDGFTDLLCRFAGVSGILGHLMRRGRGRGGGGGHSLLRVPPRVLLGYLRRFFFRG